jgi:hypothetical protein
MRLMTDDLGPGLAPPRLKERFVGRMSTRDHMTFDQIVQAGRTRDNLGEALGHRFEAAPYRVANPKSNWQPRWGVRDGEWVSQRVYDSTGAFMLGELERLDQTAHLPLAAVFWSRDIQLREDVSSADEITSYTVQTYGSPGGLGVSQSVGNSKSWSGKDVTQIQGISLDIGKIAHVLRIWDLEIKYTIPELESAVKLGRPIDAQKYDGLLLKHQMDIDEMVYYGDTGFTEYGMINSEYRSGADQVTNYANAPNGAAGSPLWAQKTPNEILADVNTILNSTWKGAAWAVIPNRLLLPPTQFSYISTQLISIAGSQSILTYVRNNNIFSSSGRGQIDIFPCKWCIGTGHGGTVTTENGNNRMMAYTRDMKYIRFPMTPLQKTPLQYDGIWQKTTYWCRLGVVEIVYPETAGYLDQIG